MAGPVLGPEDAKMNEAWSCFSQVVYSLVGRRTHEQRNMRVKVKIPILYTLPLGGLLGVSYAPPSNLPHLPTLNSVHPRPSLETARWLLTGISLEEWGMGNGTL